MEVLHVSRCPAEILNAAMVGALQPPNRTEVRIQLAPTKQSSSNYSRINAEFEFEPIHYEALSPREARPTRVSSSRRPSAPPVGLRGHCRKRERCAAARSYDLR